MIYLGSQQVSGRAGLWTGPCSVPSSTHTDENTGPGLNSDLPRVTQAIIAELGLHPGLWDLS